MIRLSIFYSGWQPIVHTIVVGVTMYVALVVLLRSTGSRSLASLNAFDFIVTVAIGAVFGRSLPAESVALSQAITAFTVLLSLQFVVAWIQTRWPRFKRVVTNPPHLLYFRDAFLGEQMRQQRMTRDDVRNAVRKRGIGSMDEVDAVVLETNGELSVVTSIGDGSTLEEITADGRDDLVDVDLDDVED